MMPNRFTRWLRLPFQALALASGAKDFSANPILASKRLNQWGLHVLRKRLAQRLCDARRRRLAWRLPAQQVAQFNRQGYLQIDDFLPAHEFDAIRRELCSASWAMLEMMQPPAVTHRANLDPHTCRRELPALYRLLNHGELRLWLQYAAGCPGQPLFALQRIVSDRGSDSGARDPQTFWHSDTFHCVGKAWFFLHAVGEHDGPFAYVPGSHLPSPARAAWEREQSLAAAAHADRLHAKGSFRVSEAELSAMGYPDPQRACVAPNTLVVADTSGFHRRTPSPKTTVRLEIYLTLRRNPFFCRLYPSVLQLPLIKQRWALMYYRFNEYLLKIGKPGWIPLPPAPLGEAERARLTRCDARHEDGLPAR